MGEEIKYTDTPLLERRILELESQNSKLSEENEFLKSYNESLTSRLEREIRNNHIDTLTGLYNRCFLESQKERLNILSFGGILYGVVFLDINGLKEINDTKGHKEGDILIKKIAQCLEETVSSRDFIIRLGGDEFLVIVNDFPPRSNEVEKDVVIDRIKEGMESRNLDISLGFAISSEGDSIDTIIDLADLRMYEDKRKIKKR